MGEDYEMSNIPGGGTSGKALADEEKQWNRITERGSVLSRYIYRPKQKNVPARKGEIEELPKLFNWAFFTYDDSLNAWVGRDSEELGAEQMTHNQDSEGSSTGTQKTKSKQRLEVLIKLIKSAASVSKIVVCENIEENDLKVVGQDCGLKTGDWARSTRWVNMPDVPRHTNKHVWSFLEIPTIWRKKPQVIPNQDQQPDNTQAPDKLKRSSTSGTERLSKDHALSKWRTRRLGIFFAQNYSPSDEIGGSEGEIPWTCLVLVEPVKTFEPPREIRQCFPPQKEEELLFCYRKIITEKWPHPPPTTPNARCHDGNAWYTIEENNLQATVRYVVTELLAYFVPKDTQTSELRTQYAKFFTALGNDIFWGWEEFATQAAQFSAVYEPLQWIRTMDREDLLVCWRLFTYTAFLNESRYLSRPVKQITMALNTRHCISDEGSLSTTPEPQQSSSTTTLSDNDKKGKRAELPIIPVPAQQALSSGPNHCELFKQLLKALEPTPPDYGGLKKLNFSLARLEGDVTKALEIVKSTIDMINNHNSSREAAYASHTNNTMEFLAVLAAIFLPLSLFISGFGMNIPQLGQGPSGQPAPQLRLALAISLGGTVGFLPVIWGGIQLWKRFYREPKKTRMWQKKISLSSV